MKRLELSPTQQRAAIALFAQREQVLTEIQKIIAEINDAIEELASLYASKAGQEGEWEFAQDAPGQPIYLRSRERNASEAEREQDNTGRAG